MTRKQQLPKSLRVFLRREKARMRKETEDQKEQEQKIEALMKQYLK